MKKMFLTAAMVSVALASCVTDESVIDGAKKDGEIKFVAANYVAQSRGGHDEIDLVNTGFTVYAWEEEKNYALMNGVAMQYANSTWTPTDNKTYYWPNNVALDFTAVSPATGNYSTVNRTADGTTTITFEFSSTANPTNVNLMYADYVNQKYDYDYATSGSGNNNTQVALLFRHVLAKLNVVLEQKDPNTHENGVQSYEVRVKELAINNIQVKGSLLVDKTYVDAAKGDNAMAVWSLPQTPETDNWEIFSGGDYSLQTNTISNGALTKTKTNFVSTEFNQRKWANYYVMPQNIEEQELYVEYEVITNFASGTTTTRTYERTKKLSEITTLENWYTNKYITYTIYISPADLTEITFSAEEENWCDNHSNDNNANNPIK